VFRYGDCRAALDGHVGRTFGYVDSDGDVWQVSVFVKGNTVFQVIAMVPKAEYAEGDPDVAKFFDSYRIEAVAESGDEPKSTDGNGK
jgi:hypothetical protein